MKVYLCWDESDYYGPDPLRGKWVFASLDSAKRAVEAANTRRTAEWGTNRDGTLQLGALYIQEVEVVE